LNGKRNRCCVLGKRFLVFIQRWTFDVQCSTFIFQNNSVQYKRNLLNLFHERTHRLHGLRTHNLAAVQL
jgi:hypothetical protein